jgi:glycosyltransferase involved in cell wall biosynthesis
MSAIWEGYRLRPRTLTGATALQIVSDPRDTSQRQAAFETAATLVRAGARAIVAGAGAALADRIRAIGAEPLDFPAATLNPLKMRRSVRLLEQIAAAERLDIVHAYGVVPAWAARMAAARMPMWVITSLPEAPARRSPALPLLDAAVARADRLIAPSSFAARSWIEQHRVPPERIAIVPHKVDGAVFSPAAIAGERIAAVRHGWGARRSERIVLVPGPLTSAGGQAVLIEAARALLSSGLRNVVFLLAHPPGQESPDVGALTRRAQRLGVQMLVRVVTLPPDLPAALTASHVVVVPALQPVSTRIVAQAQAIGRPVVVSDVGALPEAMLAPPRMPDELRTGWVVPPDDADALSRALRFALALDPVSYQALAARARQVAEFMFAPERVAGATRAVYTSLLARDS